MSVFSAAERDYVGAAMLARLATVGADGTPHVVPVGMFSHDPSDDAIVVRGRELEATKKFRDARRARRAAIVVDELLSSDPWRSRGIEVRGRAETVTGSQAAIRIHPERIVAWGIDGEGRRARSVADAEASG